MRINNIQINNWEPPGDKWWDKVAAKSDEPMIEATISMTLSHKEYVELLNKSDVSQK